jgi:hypothetical protein
MGYPEQFGLSFPKEQDMENQDIYRALADHLDSFPQGFPATKSGKELDLLAYLFTPMKRNLP